MAKHAKAVASQQPATDYHRHAEPERGHNVSRAEVHCRNPSQKKGSKKSYVHPEHDHLKRLRIGGGSVTGGSPHDSELTHEAPHEYTPERECIRPYERQRLH